MTWNRTLKIAGLNVTQFVVVLALSAPFLAIVLALDTSTESQLLVLLAAISYGLATYAVVHLTGLALRAVRGPTGYLCRHCGTDMTVALCAMGHTHEAITVGGAE